MLAMARSLKTPLPQLTSRYLPQQLTSRYLHVAKAVHRASETIVKGLTLNGLAVVPNFFRASAVDVVSSAFSSTSTTTTPLEPVCAKMRREAVTFFNNDRFRVSQSTRWNTAEPPELELYDKHNVHSMAIHHPEDTPTGPTMERYCREMGSALVTLINENVPEVQLHDTSPINKLAVCTGDGSIYEQHLDNVGTDSRKLTCILYLNPDWKAACGGQFRVHSPLHDVSVSPLIDPVSDTLVLFWSDHLLHSTLPSQAPSGLQDHRYALTLWLNGDM
jgi:hypothetical protein